MSFVVHLDDERHPPQHLQFLMRGGGATGRRAGFKIRWSASSLWVRVPPAAFSCGPNANADRVNGKDYPRYFFVQVSNDIRRLFCEARDGLGIELDRERVEDGLD